MPYLGFNSISLATNEANSHYNSLQVEFRSQMRHALTLHVAYTLSRAIDGGGAFQFGSDGQDLGGVSNPYAGWLYDVGPSQYDRHQHSPDQPYIRPAVLQE